MNDARDDYLDALSYQVKEEVINNYLRERLILEEEIHEYCLMLEEYRALQKEALERRHELACLLVTEKNLNEFLKLLDLPLPILDFCDDESIQGAPACPLGLTPRGFTSRGRFVNLAIDTYTRFYKAVEEGRVKYREMIDLADEINRDIDRFHRNFDILSIINFLNSLDINLQVRKKVMGGNFNSSEISSLEKQMMFKKLNPEADGVRSWPELPTPGEVRKKTSDHLKFIFWQEREAILPALR